MIRVAALLIAGWAVAGAASAQDAPRSGVVGADQLHSAVSNTGAAQISRATPLSAAPQQAVDRSLPQTPAAAPASPQAERQLTSERGQAGIGAQVGQREPSPGPAPTTAQRLAGRNTAVDQSDGADRCDPREERRGVDVCARVIETRAADFPTPNPEPLSPEQRLLITQRELSDQNRAVADQTRRLGAGRIDEDNVALAVASMSQAPGRPAEREEPAAETSVTDAIVAAVVSLTGVQAP